MTKPTTIALFAILSLTFIETLALLQGINGQLLRWMTIAIAGLAGWQIPTDFLNKLKGGK